LVCQHVNKKGFEEDVDVVTLLCFIAQGFCHQFACGISTAVKALSPNTKVFGAEPDALPRYSESLKAGKPVTVEQIEKTGGAGMTRKEALRSPLLYMMIGSVLLMAVGTCLIQHWPPLIAEMGYDATATGVIISFYSAVLTVGKIAQGILYSKAGIVKGAVATHVLYVLGFVLLLDPRFVYPAFFCIGLGFGIPTTLTPVLSKELFGQKEFAGIYSLISMSMSIGSFAATPAWGFLYDTLGSYRPGFLPMAVFGAAALLLQLAALRLRERSEV